MARTPLRTLRVTDDEWDRWTKAASEENLSVSAWVRSRCQPTKAKRITDNPTRPVVRPAKPINPETGEIVGVCLHRKIKPLASGLAHCEDCGRNRRADGSWPGG